MSHTARLLALLLGVIPGFAFAQEADEYRIISGRVAVAVENARAAELHEWKRIPWIDSLAKAREVSRAENCPLFLFAHNGNMGTGRC
jgi:hypothetical protein